jgi:hypothetical protein
MSIVENYISYVNEIMTKYNKASKLIYNDEINPNEINKALAEYLEINGILLTDYQIAKVNLYEIQKDFNKYYDKKFIEAKNKLEIDVPRSVKISDKAVDIQVRVDNESQYYEKESQLEEAKYRVAHVRRVLDLYKNFQNILIALSQNMRQEMRTLHLENNINYNESKIRNTFPKRG